VDVDGAPLDDQSGRFVAVQYGQHLPAVFSLARLGYDFTVTNSNSQEGIYR